MSLRAELVRLCLPLFMRRLPTDIQLESVRRQVAHFGRLVPPPPRGTEVLTIDAGGVQAERITRPRSLPNRYVLHLAAPICSAFQHCFAILPGASPMRPVHKC